MEETAKKIRKKYRASRYELTLSEFILNWDYNNSWYDLNTTKVCTISHYDDYIRGKYATVSRWSNPLVYMKTL